MILCCGEALIDMIPAQMADGAPAFMPCVGGAVFNTAVALGRLETDVSLLSGVSNDVFGEMLATALVKNNVGVEFLVRSDRLSTLAVVHLENGSATYSFYDENSAGRMLDIADFPPVPEDATCLYFGGISLVAEPAADAYADLLAQAGDGRVVMLDPNIRPDFIGDVAAYRSRLDRMLALCDIVKVSDEDLAWIAQGEGSLEDMVRQILSKGPHVVILTLGANGAAAYTASGSVRVDSARATVVDTVGAGDTFNAGVLSHLAETGALAADALRRMTADDFGPALSRGAQVAGVTVSRAGANPPWASELDD